MRWHGAAVGPAERLRFGYMPEERGLYPRMRVGEQVAYFARLHGHSTSAAQTATDHWLERLGLADRSDDRVEMLSHGNQQRVQLAAALVHAPDLVLLDEPFAGLDPPAVASLGAMLREEAARGAAVLFSSHQLDLVTGPLRRHRDCRPRPRGASRRAARASAGLAASLREGRGPRGT